MQPDAHCMLAIDAEIDGRYSLHSINKLNSNIGGGGRQRGKFSQVGRSLMHYPNIWGGRFRFGKKRELKRRSEDVCTKEVITNYFMIHSSRRIEINLRTR
jgi:hypothetical protein